MDLEDNIYTALKKRIEALSQLTEEEWTDFSSKWKQKSVAKNEYLLKPGQVEGYFYFVGVGVIRVFGENEGEEINVGFTYDNEYSGVYDSFLAQKPTDLYLQAITDCQIIRIHYTDLMDQIDKHRSIERWNRKFNAEMLIGVSRRQVEARSFSAEEKFKRLMDNSPHIFQLVPQKHLASYLGMTPETLSRLRKKVR